MTPLDRFLCIRCRALEKRVKLTKMRLALPVRTPDVLGNGTGLYDFHDQLALAERPAPQLDREAECIPGRPIQSAALHRLAGFHWISEGRFQ